MKKIMILAAAFLCHLPPSWAQDPFEEPPAVHGVEREVKRVPQTSIAFAIGVPEDIVLTLLEDLRYVAEIRGSGATPLHRQAFGGSVDGRLYIKWLEDRIKVIDIFKIDDAAAGFLDGRLIFGAATFRKWRRAERIGLLFHEARHADSRHGRCDEAEIDNSTGVWDRLPVFSKIDLLFNRERKFPCDHAVQGSYATAALTLLNIGAYCANCSVRDQIEMRVEALSQVANVMGFQTRRELNQDLAGMF